MAEKKHLYLILLSFILLSCVEKVPFNIQYGFNKDATIREIASGKKNYQISQNDLELIFQLYNSRNPIERTAAVYLLNSAPDNSFHSFVLLAVADPDPQVSETAFQLSKKSRVLTEQLIEEAIGNDDIRLIISAVVYYHLDDNKRKIQDIVGFFGYQNESLNKFVIQYLLSFYPENSERILSYIEDDNRGIRGGIYEFLGTIHDPIVIPYLINGLADPEPYVQQKALSSLINYKEQSFPEITQNLNSYSEHQLIQLLYLFEAVESEKCIEICVRLLSSENYEIRNKARALILLYDDQSVPYLIELIQIGNEREVINSLKILGLLNENRSIPSIVALLDSSSPSLRNEAKITIMKKGDICLPYLRQGILMGGDLLRQNCLEILIEVRDPELIINSESGLLNSETTLLLIYQTTNSQLENYLESIPINNQIRKEILTLKELISISQILKETLDSQWLFPFFQEYLLWEENYYHLLQAEKRMREQKRNFLLTQDQSILGDIAVLNNDIEEMKRESNERLIRLNNYPESEINSGRQRINQYIVLNEQLLSHWNSLTFYTQELGNRIIENEQISSEYITRIEQQAILGIPQPF